MSQIKRTELADGVFFYRRKGQQVQNHEDFRKYNSPFKPRDRLC